MILKCALEGSQSDAKKFPNISQIETTWYQNDTQSDSTLRQNDITNHCSNKKKKGMSGP